MKSVLKKLSYVFIGNIFNAISKFLIIIFIVNIKSETELGIYTFALAITAPITLLFNMKLRSYIMSSDYVDFKKMTRFRNISNAFSIILVIFIAFLFYNEIALTILLVAIIKIIDINSEYYQAYPNKEKIFEMPAVLMIVKVSISTVLFFAVLYYSQDLNQALLIQVIFMATYLFFERSRNLSLVNINSYVSEVQIKNLFYLLIPLGMVQAILSFSTNIPKYLLEQFESFEAVGIFSGIIYIVSIFNLLMMTLNQTLLPYLKDIYSKNLKKYNLILNLILNLSALIVGIVFISFSYLMGEAFLTLVFSNEFAEHAYLLYVFGLVISLNISGWAYDSSLLLAGAFKYQPYILVVVSVITIFIGYLLVRESGLFGAGLTLLALNFLNTFSKALYYNIHIKRGERNP